MAGDLFEHGVSPNEINAMSLDDLKYWSDWSQKCRKAEVKALNDRISGIK
jgi:hypothetical protein